MRKIRQGDDVVVVTGKDKGRRGTVLRVVEDGARVVVEGVNMVKKHQKPNPMIGRTGGIIEMEKPVDISNVMLFNPASEKGDRVGFKTLEDGRKVRYFKSNGEVVDA
ncbi:50S ribosomal protein L24 [Guyparkeria hydrothermalis]|uniref:Large ribosomal subunit protein uL24 n=1 Tax=Guyparkeria halophila TaxID=47960 RepID=A0A6I6DBV2_9GAMM|nr:MULTISPECIES: 50S ribosomal protein L24 [Guyparkeria]MCL7750787.1 50S ribosomal protein L24 [Guyparkeria hydrothermalis]QGT79222.1 50S ribosomal protein L24 [Guyparkeria halophila]TKA88848.1 50S ribosomal protein L24 [Guyparkeria sp. SB14A]